jgi:hypothetical protein
MAHLPRVGKPVQEWNQQDLCAYNIHVHPQPQSVFFDGLRCCVLPSLPSTSPFYPFLTMPVHIPNQNVTPHTATLLTALHSPVQFSNELDGVVDNFVAHLIASMGPPYPSSQMVSA